MRLFWLLPLTLLLGGCPQTVDPVDDAAHLQYLDQYPEITNALTDEDGYRDEMKRLQGLYTHPASLGHASGGSASSIFELSSRVEDGRIGMVLHDTHREEDWVLWLWQDEAVGDNQLSIIEDGHTAGGYRLEFNVRDSALTVNVNARWLQGRYLQISRELILGGLDHSLLVSDGYTTWEIDGPWLPYRMVPSATGPYGVAIDEQADGEWHTQQYPFECMIPAVGAYDAKHGMLLGVADEHPRRLDRDYDVSFRIATDYTDGGALRLAYRNYDPINDNYALPTLFSGLPVRDTIVLEPLLISDSSTDETLVYTETDEVIRLLGQQVRCFHFEAAPPERLLPGAYINAGDWVADRADIPEFLRVASGIWEAKVTSAQFFDSTLDAGGNVGLGAAELEGGSGISPEVLTTLAEFDSEFMPVMANVDYLNLSTSRAYAAMFPEWLIQTGLGEDAVPVAGSLIDIRNPEPTTWLVGKMAADITTYPEVAGYSMAHFPSREVTGQPHQSTGYLMSYAAAASSLMLKTVEAVRANREDVLIMTNGLPRLAVPAFGNYHVNADWSYGIETPSSVKSSTTYPALPALGSLDHARRFSNTVLWEVFGIAPCIDYGGTPAHQVIASSRTTYGHALHREHEGFEGFDEYAAHQRDLIAAGGELLVVYSYPLQAIYTKGDERPAICEEMVAVLPADWSSTQTFWIAFHGTGGRVTVDERNILTISWSDGGYTERKLPSGFWVTHHPSPEAVQAGDVVMYKRKTVRTPDRRGGVSS